MKCLLNKTDLRNNGHFIATIFVLFISFLTFLKFAHQKHVQNETENKFEQEKLLAEKSKETDEILKKLDRELAALQRLKDSVVEKRMFLEREKYIKSILAKENIWIEVKNITLKHPGESPHPIFNKLRPVSQIT